MKLEAPRGRGRPKTISDDDRRERIVACTRQLMLKQGYAHTTTDQIAAKCHISKQTLYSLFPDKIALFTAIIDAHRQSMLALPGDYDDLPADVALEKIFRIDIDTRENTERMAILKLVLAESTTSPELRTVLQKHGKERSHAELAGWLTHQAERGKIVIEDAEQDAQILMDMIFGPAVRQTVGKLPEDKHNSKAHLRRCVRIFLDGVAR